MFGNCLIQVVGASFWNMVQMIIMAKIIPPGIEGTMISITNTIMFLSNLLLRNVLGIFLNDTFAHVTVSKLDNFSILCLFQLLFRLLPLFYIGLLVPRNKQVDDLQTDQLEKAKQ